MFDRSQQAFFATFIQKLTHLKNIYIQQTVFFEENDNPDKSDFYK
jgi:hypothetical protein